MSNANVNKILNSYCELGKFVLQPYGLTKNEIEVTLKMIQGLGYREIGRLMRLTEPTIRFHAKNAINKCGVKNRQQLCFRVYVLIRNL